MSRRSGLGGVTKVYRRDATNPGPAHPMEPFSLVFLDPPYGKGLAEKALAALRDGGWLTPGALLVVEEAKAAAFAAPEGFEELERRAYDDTEFMFLRFGAVTCLTRHAPRMRDPVRFRQSMSDTMARSRAQQRVRLTLQAHLRPNSFSISLSFNST